MKWFKNLYIGESFNKTADELINDIIVKNDTKRKYLITLPANDKNMLDIITAKEGIIISWREVYVIGIAKTKAEAFDLTSLIISEVYHKTNGFDLREYFDDFI